MGNGTKYYKQITKKSGEVKNKPISEKKYERKAEMANKDVWDENPDNKVILRPQASYSPKGKTTLTKVIKRGDKPRKKTFIKENFEPGKEEPTHQQGGYIQSPLPMRKDLERSALMMKKIKNPINFQSPINNVEDGDPPKKTPEYKEFQSDSTTFAKGNFNYIKTKYPIDFGKPPSEQKPQSMQFYKDFKQGYSGKKTK